MLITPLLLNFFALGPASLYLGKKKLTVQLTILAIEMKPLVMSGE